jgi:predicted membrane-bound spermidine synthase
VSVVAVALRGPRAGDAVRAGRAAGGLVGGFSSAILFVAFAYTASFRVVLYALVFVVGVLVGLEIPLLMRILRDRFDFKDVVAHVLTFDYLGALGASLLFRWCSCRTLGCFDPPCSSA